MFDRISIKHKQMLIIMLTSSVALLLASGAIVGYELVTFRQNMVRDLLIEATLIGGLSTAAMSFDDPATADEILKELHNKEHIMAAVLYKDGKEFAKYVRPDIKSSFVGPAQGLEGHEFKGNHLEVFRPVNLKGESIGTVFIQSDLRGLHDRIVQYAGIVGMVFLASSMVAFVISARLQGLISHPILELAATAKQVSTDKNFSVRAVKRSQDELGTLIDGFNEMLGQIQRRDAALQEAHNQLEIRVEERTRELQQEIVERKRAEQALSVSELRFRSLFQSANDAIILADGKGRIILWNHGAHSIFGYEESEVLGHPLNMIMPQGYGDSHREGAELFRSTGEPNIIGKAVEVNGLRKDGNEVPLELNLTTWRSPEGTFFSAIIRDITERKQAENVLASQTRELARSNEELQQFAYVASHDLQEPLRMVSNYTQLLARRYKGRLDSDADEFIAFAVDGATRMQGLINDLLAYSRVGRRGQDFAPFDCAIALGQAIVNLKVAIEEHHALITNDELPVIVGDQSQFTQLFQNLIGNAIKFHREEHSRVHISARELEEDWLFSVHDNGIGIDPQYAERIFVIFQRLHGFSEYPGTGIGLAICRKIVERHGGRIWVESQLGQGSTFSFTIQKRSAILPGAAVLG